MRFIPLILVLLFFLGGIAFGALNPQDVTLDFYSHQLTLPLGVALLGFGLGGALAAGVLLWLAVIWPQRRRIAALKRQCRTASATAAQALPDATHVEAAPLP